MWIINTTDFLINQRIFMKAWYEHHATGSHSTFILVRLILVSNIIMETVRNSVVAATQSIFNARIWNFVRKKLSSTDINL
jgi:hypothetical protein